MRRLNHPLFILGLWASLAVGPACSSDDEEGGGTEGDTETDGTDGTEDADGGDSADDGADDGSADGGSDSADGGSDSADGGSDSTDDGTGGGTGDTGDTGGTADGTGDDGSTGDGGTTAGDTSGDSTTGGAGDSYPPCDNGSCDGDAECEEDNQGGIQGDFCGDSCENAGQCPAANGGEAVPDCGDINGDGITEMFCFLDCADGGGMLECPAGMECGALNVHESLGSQQIDMRRVCVWP